MNNLIKISIKENKKVGITSDFRLARNTIVTSRQRKRGSRFGQ